jgi:hypothetical protein
MEVVTETKVLTATLPSVPELLREQLDAVSSLRVGKLRKTDPTLVSKYLFGDEELGDRDKARAERIGTSLLLRWVIGESGKLIVTDDEFARLLKEHIRPSNTQYEEFLAYEFIAKLGDMGRRARTVYSLWVKNPPSGRVAALCREACQTYVQGYHSASVALIRAVVEACIREKLGRDLGTLGPLNDRALEEKLYDRTVWERVKRLKQCGDKLLHRGSIPTEEQNLSAIKHAQAALTVLHRSDVKSAL